MGGFSGGNAYMQMGSMAMSLLNAAGQKSADRQGQQDAQQSYDLQMAALRRQQDAQVRQRQDLLKRTLATQRARLGAMGVGSGSGSAEALVSGLTEQAATDVTDIQRGYGDSVAALDFKRERQSRGSGDTGMWSSLLSSVGSLGRVTQD